MKRFFLNKKLMAFVLCLCLGVIIVGVGAFAAASSGLPGMSILSEKLGNPLEHQQNSSSSQSEVSKPDLETSDEIVIEPDSPSADEKPDEPQPTEPIVYAAPERMMAVTLTAGKDYFTDSKMSTADIQGSIDSAIKKAKDLSANTVFLETSYEGGTLFASAGGNQAAVSMDMLKYAGEKAREHGMYVYVVFDVLKYKLPIIKNVQIDMVASKFTKSTGLLLSSGMNLVDALEVVKNLLGNRYVQKQFACVIEDVRRGASLTFAMDNYKVFPQMLIQMLSTGEKTGAIDDILLRTQNYFDQEVEASILRATAVIQPVMLIVMGLVIGMLFIAIYSPMITIMQQDFTRTDEASIGGEIYAAIMRFRAYSPMFARF